VPTVKTMDLGDYDDDGGDLALVNSGAEQIRMVPESQHALMSAAMLDAKRARMKVENDREALANRIARLQAEELRATKRIEQTHHRTQEILGAKNRHHQELKMKEQKRHEHDAILEQHREELNKIREERKEILQQTKEQSRQERQTLARLNREEAMHNADVIAYSRASELNAAMFKRNEVRKIEADARERKLREKELMIAHQQQRAEERQREENSRADGYDKLLTDLEREEYDLLVAIEGHRRERQELYEDLEDKLGRGKTKGSSSKARLLGT